MFKGNPTKAEWRKQEKKKKQDELGVCRIRRKEGNQSSETLGSGFVVKNLPIVEAIDCQYCLISSNKVFPNGCDIKSYYLDFKKLNKQNLKTVKLEDIVSSTKINRDLFSGLVVIPIQPSINYSKEESIFTYRPFKVVNEGGSPNQDLRCHFIEVQKEMFSVKRLTLKQTGTNQLQYQLLEPPDPPYTTYGEVTSKGSRDRKPYGGAILKNDDSGYVVVGAMSFTDDDRRDISPVFFRHSSGHEHRNQEINVATADRTDAPEATVSVAGAAETVPLHLNGTHVESLTGNPLQVEAEDTVDVSTDNERAQRPTPEANSYDHHHGEEQNVPDPANAYEVANPNPSNEAARHQDTVPGHKHQNQERTGAVDGKIETPNLEATVSTATATPKESLQPGETNAESLTINPIQEGGENTVDAGATGNETAQQPTPAANSDVHRLVTDQLISEVVTDNSLFLEKLSKYLDRESRLIMCWKHLAYVIGVPREERNQFDMYTEHSPTEDLFNYLSDFWNPDLKVIELKGKLKLIHCNDVIADIEKGGFKDGMKVSDLIFGDPKFIKLLSPKLDIESRTIGNWRSLAAEFGIRKQKTEQFGLRGSGPTGALFSYMRTAKGLQAMTMGQLRSHFLEMESKYLVNLLDKQNIQGSWLVKDVLVDGSELLSDIGERLNKEITAVKNWRNLAYRLKIPPETCSSFDTSKEKAKSPTKMMFQWLAKWKPDLNIGDLLKSIEATDRFDVVEIVTKEAEAALEKLKKQCAFVDGSTEQHTANEALHDLQQMHQDAEQRSVKTFNFDSNLRKNASDKGFTVSENPGEGDCMFYALSEQLYFAKRIQHSAAELRQEIVQYLQQNPKLPDGTDLVNFTPGYPSWTSYLEEMAKDGTSGDNVILLAAANHLNTRIRVISSLLDHEDIIINPNGADTLVLGHVHEEHYVSLLPVTVGSDEGVPRGNPQVVQRNGQDRQYGQHQQKHVS